MKTLAQIVLMALLAVTAPFIAFADTVTTTTTTTVIRSDAPIYMGLLDTTAVLEPLTLEEFQNFGTKPAAAFQQYQDYQLKLKNPNPNTGPLPFKVKIYRTLTRTDFEAVDVSPELAEQRYQNYLRLTPMTENGQEIRYVYVYREPV